MFLTIELCPCAEINCARKSCSRVQLGSRLCTKSGDQRRRSRRARWQAVDAATASASGPHTAPGSALSSRCTPPRGVLNANWARAVPSRTHPSAQQLEGRCPAGRRSRLPDPAGRRSFAPEPPRRRAARPCARRATGQRGRAEGGSKERARGDGSELAGDGRGRAGGRGFGGAGERESARSARRVSGAAGRVGRGQRAVPQREPRPGAGVYCPSRRLS